MFVLGDWCWCLVWVLVASVLFMFWWGFTVLVCYFSDFAGCGALCYGVAVVVCFCLWVCGYVGV